MRLFFIFLFIVVASLTYGSAETPQPETKAASSTKTSEQPIEVKFDSYIAHLDSRPEARLEGWSYSSYLTEDAFEALRLRHRPSTFEYWKDKLHLVRPGMTIKDMVEILKPKNDNGLSVCFGSGIYTYIELDDAYFTYGHFSYDGKLIDLSANPLAITYTVTQGVLLPQKK